MKRFAAMSALLAIWPVPAFAQEHVIYQYDGLGRLASATHQLVDASIVTTYRHDSADNRNSVNAAVDLSTSCTVVPINAGFTVVRNKSAIDGEAQITTEGVCSGPVVVSYWTSNGSALSGVNYTPTSGQIIVQPGKYNRYPLYGMGLGNDEYLVFYVNFSIVSGFAKLDPATALVGIAAD